MRRLILMRHAKSDWSHAGLRDHDRPLNDRGQGSAKALGRWLHETSGTIPEMVLCSSARRTQETLAGLDLPTDLPIRISTALYHATAAQMFDELRRANGRCVLMIGHNPGICEMAHRLVAKPPPHERFSDYPTGATLVVDFEIEHWADTVWHTGQPVDFAIPRELPKVA